MPEYRAPIDDVRFVLNELAGLPRLTATVAAYQSATPDVVDSILVEAAKLAGEVISPLNRSGDLKGVEVLSPNAGPEPGPELTELHAAR